jgi:hypothetical protein
VHRAWGCCGLLKKGLHLHRLIHLKSRSDQDQCWIGQSFEISKGASFSSLQLRTFRSSRAIVGSWCWLPQCSIIWRPQPDSWDQRRRCPSRARLRDRTEYLVEGVFGSGGDGGSTEIWRLWLYSIRDGDLRSSIVRSGSFAMVSSVGGSSERRARSSSKLAGNGRRCVFSKAVISDSVGW